jgi:malonyl-CoA O-methyltransferase
MNVHVIDLRPLRLERISCVGLVTLLKRRIWEKGIWPFPVDVPPVIEDLNVCDAYRAWAPTYAAETATSFLDEELAQEMLGGLPQTRLLDAGCGIGRRIQDIPTAVGIDLSPEMLAQGDARNVVAGDIRKMPFKSNRFDMVWCRLVLGHLSDPLLAYREIFRVCMPGGYVFVTDFHPDAVAAGHRRTLTDGAGIVHGIEHYVHINHIQLAAEAGLDLIASRDGLVSPSIRDFYLRGIGLKAYERDIDLKLVAAFLFRKPDARGTALV